MKKREKAARKRAVVFIFCLLLVLAAPVFSQSAKAASAAMNLYLSASEITVDHTFSVVLTVESSEDIGELEAYISFDKKALKFVSGGKYVTGGKGLAFIMDHSDQSGTTKKYSMKFKALQGGETTLKISDSKVLCSADDLEMSISKNQLLFTVKDPERVNDDADLKSLVVSPGELSPKFAADTKRYQVEVGAETEALSVSAVPSDSKATVTVSGNEEFVTGKNEVKIKVTAPSGDHSVTTLTVIKRSEGAGEDMQSGGAGGRTAEGEEEPEQDLDFGKAAQDTELPADGITAREEEEGSVLVTDFQQIRILPLPDGTSLPQDFIDTTVVISGIPVTVYTPKYNLDSDRLLMYGESRDGKQGFYLFDRKTNQLQEYDGTYSDGESEEKESITQDEEETEKYRHKMWLTILLSIILGICCVALLCALLLQSHRNKRKNQKIEEDDIFKDYPDF